jgi:hypothetical protein
VDEPLRPPVKRAKPPSTPMQAPLITILHRPRHASFYTAQPGTTTFTVVNDGATYFILAGLQSINRR